MVAWVSTLHLLEGTRIPVLFTIVPGDAAKKEIIDGILPYRFVQIIIGQFIRQAKGPFYLVVGATHSAGTWSEYELAALDMVILFNITVCGHFYRLSPLEGFTKFVYDLNYPAVWAGQASWRVKRRVSNLDKLLS